MGDAGTQQAPHHKHVTIVDENGVVDQDEVEVWWDQGHQVIWHNSTAHPCRVVFDGESPFDSIEFQVPAHGETYSGLGRRGGRFKYTVHGHGGCNDPIIILHPP